MIQNDEFNEGVVDPTECISKGWEAVTQNLGLYVGVAVVWLIISFITGFIPILGFVFVGPLMCGIYLVFINHFRGESVSFEMMFAGFKVFVPAMVAGLIYSIPQIVSSIVGYTSLILMGVAAYTQNGAMMDGLMALQTVISLISYGSWIFTIVFAVLLYFVFQLVIDRDMKAIDAVKLSFRAAKANLGGIIVLSILNGLILIAGILALCVGVFIALPLIYAANAYAYLQVFPDAKIFDSPFATPPPPDAYGDIYSHA